MTLLVERVRPPRETGAEGDSTTGNTSLGMLRRSASAWGTLGDRGGEGCGEVQKDGSIQGDCDD
jgi:hypothetical protein